MSRVGKTPPGFCDATPGPFKRPCGARHAGKCAKVTVASLTSYDYPPALDEV